MALLVRPSSVCRHSVCFNVSKRYVASRAARSGPGRVWTSSNEVARPDHTWSASWRARKAASPCSANHDRPLFGRRGTHDARQFVAWRAGRQVEQRQGGVEQRPCSGRQGGRVGRGHRDRWYRRSAEAAADGSPDAVAPSRACTASRYQPVGALSLAVGALSRAGRAGTPPHSCAALRRAAVLRRDRGRPLTWQGRARPPRSRSPGAAAVPGSLSTAEARQTISRTPCHSVQEPGQGW